MASTTFKAAKQYVQVKMNRSLLVLILLSPTPTTVTPYRLHACTGTAHSERSFSSWMVVYSYISLHKGSIRAHLLSYQEEEEEGDNCWFSFLPRDHPSKSSM